LYQQENFIKNIISIKIYIKKAAAFPNYKRKLAIQI